MTWYNSWLKPVALAEVLAWLWRRCCFSMPSADWYADRCQLTASSPPQEYLALPSPPLLLPFFLPPWCGPILTLHAFLLDLSDLYGVSFPIFFCMLLREDRWWENPKSMAMGWQLQGPAGATKFCKLPLSVSLGHLMGTLDQTGHSQITFISESLSMCPRCDLPSHPTYWAMKHWLEAVGTASWEPPQLVTNVVGTTRNHHHHNIHHQNK